MKATNNTIIQYYITQYNTDYVDVMN